MADDYESDTEKSCDESLEELLGLKDRPKRRKIVPARFCECQLQQVVAESIIEDNHSEYIRMRVCMCRVCFMRWQSF